MASYAHALNTVVGADIDPREVRSWIGRTLWASFEARWPDHTDALIEAYRAYNWEHTPTGVSVYSGMPELLADLTAAGITVGVATSKGRAIAERTLQLLALDLPITVAAEDTVHHKPDPGPLLLARERLAATGPAVYVGDAVVDVQAAQAAGLDAIAVNWGAGEPDALVAASPTALASTVDELRALLLG